MKTSDTVIVFYYKRINSMKKTCSSTKLLTFCTIINTPKQVWGIAVIDPEFVPSFHCHKEAETYYILRGSGMFYLGLTSSIKHSPCMCHISGNIPHKMHTSTREPVILLYHFTSGPFEKIEYTFYTDTDDST